MQSWPKCQWNSLKKCIEKLFHNLLDQTVDKYYSEVNLSDIREENANLSKERAVLQSEVERQRILMKELTDQMDGLRTMTSAERKERARAALKVSEGIAAERESLVSELNLMRVINTKMVDDRDLAVAAEGDPRTGRVGNRGGKGSLASEMPTPDPGTLFSAVVRFYGNSV